MVLSYLHSNDIVHRDIKPENIIFLDSKNYDTIKVIDFGCAEIVDHRNHEKLQDWFGSPYYIAPEVLNKSYGVKCDVWSAGVIFFKLLTGRLPFDHKDDNMIL